MRPLVKYSGDASVRFLASCVPNLELYDMVIVDFHHIVSEFYTYSNIMVFMERILDESHQDR